jgi:hypothetical protein
MALVLCWAIFGAAQLSFDPAGPLVEHRRS